LEKFPRTTPEETIVKALPSRGFVSNSWFRKQMN
jgi:hypothetical protein